ncbi:hypothetical protein LMG24235_06976 [Paraburkholderia sabiae]|nr:hypothetical protein LMG24235_06976 [Paraburkholderia sabiae]
MKHRYEFTDASAAKSKKAKKQKAKNQRQGMATSVADKKTSLNIRPKPPPSRPILLFYINKNNINRARLNIQRLASSFSNRLDELALLLNGTAFKKFDTKSRHGL